MIGGGIDPKEGWVDYIRKFDYDAYTDYPMNERDLYQEIDKAFLKSKFILTIRDKKSYAESYINFFRGSPWEIKSTKELKQRIQAYEKRNKQVIEYFKERPSQFLVMNIIDGEGWNKLCMFLNKPIPKKPFPQKNKGRYKSS